MLAVDEIKRSGKPGPKPGSGHRAQGGRRVPADIDPATYARVEKLLTRGWTPLVQNLLSDWIASADGRVTEVEIPIRGQTAGGVPIFADDHIEGYLRVPSTFANGENYALLVRGDSMEPLIKDGEYVIVKPQENAEKGQVVVALINEDQEGTVKKYSKRGRWHYLEPLNTEGHDPILSEDTRIIGVVIGAANPVVRRI